jgi:hypothetical protein
MIAGEPNPPSGRRGALPGPGDPSQPCAAPGPISTADEFLEALVGANFDLREVARHLTPEQLLGFAADPHVRATLESFCDPNDNERIAPLMARCVLAATDALRKLVESGEFPVEVRRATKNLRSALKGLGIRRALVDELLGEGASGLSRPFVATPIPTAPAAVPTAAAAPAPPIARARAIRHGAGRGGSEAISFPSGSGLPSGRRGRRGRGGGRGGRRRG